MKWIPYLAFNGHCKDAFTFYQSVLGGEIKAMIPHRGTPAETHVPEEWRDKIVHARLECGDLVLMAGDAPPGFYREPQGFSVHVAVDTAEEAERIFAALSENGTVKMPMGETFWALRFGMAIDRFGIPWMVNCDLPAG